jgi:hypothetical protein
MPSAVRNNSAGESSGFVDVVMPSSSSSSSATNNMPSSTQLMLLSSKKTREHFSKSLQEHLATPASQFAHDQLRKMGWQAGQALGKRQDGLTRPIQVKRRADAAGLGTEQVQVQTQLHNDSWWKSSLGNTLEKLSASNDKKKKKKKKKDVEPKKEFTDEELFTATGGARFGMRANPTTRSLAKWRRSESEIEEDASDAKNDEQDQSDVKDNIVEKAVKKSKRKREKKEEKIALKKDKKKKLKK